MQRWLHAYRLQRLEGEDHVDTEDVRGGAKQGVERTGGRRPLVTVFGPDDQVGMRAVVDAAGDLVDRDAMGLEPLATTNETLAVVHRVEQVLVDSRLQKYQHFGAVLNKVQ